MLAGRARRGAAQRGEELRKQILAAEEAPLDVKPQAPRGGVKRLAPPRSTAELDGACRGRAMRRNARAAAPHSRCQLGATRFGRHAASPHSHLIAHAFRPNVFAAFSAGGDSSDGEDEEGEGGRRRGAALTPEEREAKRLRRLMRNRASAQQARERKRDWMAGIEERASTLEERVAALNNQVNALERTNWTLRSLIKTATASAAAAPRSEEPVVIMVRAPQTFLFDEAGVPTQPAPMPVMAGGAA